MNAIFETIRDRSTIHFFLDKPVSEELIQHALEAAIRAPNHKLTNPWRFIRIGPKTRTKITNIAVALKGQDCGGLSPAAEAKVRKKVGSSPEMIVVIQELNEDLFRRKEDYASVSCAIQNLSLFLWAEGVGSKWSTGGYSRTDALYELLNIDRASQEIVGAIFIGYAEKEHILSGRRDLSEVLTSTE